MPASKPAKAAPPLPAIPDKRYFTIGEVSELCAVKQHVLRYWEQEFPQLKPVKRRGNRRYYQPHEIQLIRRIRELLYDQGFTIQGARSFLSAGKSLAPIEAPLPNSTLAATPEHDARLLGDFKAEIQSIIALLKRPN